jgi:energy-coupling factor transporter ATP-binding protein EcfA2
MKEKKKKEDATEKLEKFEIDQKEIIQQLEDKPKEKVEYFIKDPKKDAEEDKQYFSNNCQWVINDGVFYAIGKTTKNLPCGYYTYSYNQSLYKIVYSKIRIITDDILKLPDPTLSNILSDFQKFWCKKHLYQKYEYIYKRAYLMFGPAGCGKTSLISLLAKELIEKNGIVLQVNGCHQIDYYEPAIKDIRTIERDKPIIVIIEDIDGYTDTSYVSKLLNILDGAYQTDNVIIIATTNYPERLEERFSSRPSRFDVRVLIDLPNADVRKFYIESKLKPEDLAKINVNDWIKATEGFTLDHLKELILLTFVLENDFDESLGKIKEMLKNTRIKPVSIKGSNSNIGFIGGGNPKAKLYINGGEVK